MKKDLDLKELRELVRTVLEEDVPGVMPQGVRSVPPPLPQAARKPASAALPAPNALNKFKADVNMAVDAATRVKAAVDAADTKEALRWLDKVISFATSAKTNLNVK